MNKLRKLKESRFTHHYQSVASRLVFGGLLACSIHAGNALAAGEVTFIDTSDELATPLRFEVDGITYSWGMSTNQIMQGFTADGQDFGFFNSVDRVELVRNDVEGVSNGNPCGVFVERVGASSEVLSASYPSDGSGTGNCDMAAMLASRVLNRGALNLFSNDGPNPKNVERVDYIFDRGLLAPLSSAGLTQSGHVVSEKSGNNPLQIAAIKAVDIFGQPTEYGPLVLVDRNGCAGDTICYGITNLRHNYSFFQNNSIEPPPQGFPSFLKDSTESVGMAFVSLKDLGVAEGEVYYGFSYFADDVDAAVHTLSDVSTFPNNTQDEEIIIGDGPDIYGGVSGYFLAANLNVVTGVVFLDENGDGIVNDNEAGISDITLSLFEDTNGNGVFDANEDMQVGPSFNTDVNGEFVVPGLGDGIFFILLDESDDDLPPAISVAPGTNPAMIVIAGNDVDGVNFSFVRDTGPSDAGAGSDAGDTGSDAGDAGSDAGDAGSDAGDAGSDAGDAGSDAGDTGSDAGDAGDTDAGGNDDDFIIINDGANETVAVADTATVNQGSSVLIDVLANDTDASGQGLTIISVSESPNATIEIQDGVIVYTPNPDFSGTDSFIYVIEDGAGNQSPGTVTVEVERFSDINNNGLNDFVECDCDSLEIEVGVDGSALGAASTISFAFLALLVAMRRFVGLRRKSIHGGVK